MSLTAQTTVRSNAGIYTGYLPWMLLGIVATAFSLTVFGSWLMSPTAFSPVPITAAQAMAEGGGQRIRMLEWISSAIGVVCLLAFLIVPWLRNGRAPIVGLVMIGALISYVLDTAVNYSGYVMAWNVHSINFGTWAAHFPGHTGPTRYAEALCWGPPMYLYFGVVLGLIQLTIFNLLYRSMGFIAAGLLSFAAAFFFDAGAESLIIQTTEAYAWANTVARLSWWPGTQFQFPQYESLMVAIYSTGYALLLNSSHRHQESFIEQGCSDLPAPLRLPARLLAATGFATLMTLIYFVGFGVFSQYADSPAPLPTYLMPGN
jgi:hypothetical protein